VHGARFRTRRHKKTRIPKEPGFPVSPNGFRPAAGPHREDAAGSLLQAGFLTLGSSYRLRLPTGRPTSNPLELRNAPWYAKGCAPPSELLSGQAPASGLPAAFVPDHSGGPVPDLHGIPS
jgi:hypothetical protein